MTDKPPEPISIKQIQVIEAVARYRGFALAADQLNMSQSVISRSVKTVEKNLGKAIFQRGWGGAEPTAAGEIIVRHCIYALVKIQELEANLQQQIGKKIPLLAYLKWHQLEAIGAVTRYGSASNAAHNIGLKQPAISRAILAVADFLGVPIFIRKREGLEATAVARQFTALFENLQKEWEILPSKFNMGGQGLVGRVAVGMLPFSGQDLVAKAFGKLSNQHPHLRLIAVSGNYNMLIQALRQGDIDCIIGMLRQPSPHHDLVETEIYNEEYKLIARTDHPCNQANISPALLQNQKWIGAPHGTPVRDYLEAFFKNYNLAPPTQTCEIHSFINAEQMIVESDLIALLSYSPEKLKDLRPELKIIDIEMPNPKNAIGLTYLASRFGSESIKEFEMMTRNFSQKA